MTEKIIVASLLIIMGFINISIGNAGKISEQNLIGKYRTVTYIYNMKTKKMKSALGNAEIFKDNSGYKFALIGVNKKTKKTEKAIGNCTINLSNNTVSIFFNEKKSLIFKIKGNQLLWGYDPKLKNEQTYIRWIKKR